MLFTRYSWQDFTARIRAGGCAPATHGSTRKLMLCAIADELSLAGLATCLHESRASIDVTATLASAGQRETEVTVDEDAYIEMRFWHNPDATPAQVAYVITTALTAITNAQQP